MAMLQSGRGGYIMIYTAATIPVSWLLYIFSLGSNCSGFTKLLVYVVICNLIVLNVVKFYRDLIFPRLHFVPSTLWQKLQWEGEVCVLSVCVHV